MVNFKLHFGTSLGDCAVDEISLNRTAESVAQTCDIDVHVRLHTTTYDDGCPQAVPALAY